MQQTCFLEANNAHLVETFPTFYGTWSSLLCSQATGPHPKPVEISPNPHTIFLHIYLPNGHIYTHATFVVILCYGVHFHWTEPRNMCHKNKRGKRTQQEKTEMTAKIIQTLHIWSGLLFPECTVFELWKNFL